MEDKKLISYILLKEITRHFEIEDVKESADGALIIYLDEKKEPPEENQGIHLISKGFYPAKKILDFPIRDRAVILQVRIRKWEDPATGKIYSKNWDLVAKGTRYTKGFAFFLKGMAG